MDDFDAFLYGILAGVIIGFIMFLFCIESFGTTTLDAICVELNGNESIYLFAESSPDKFVCGFEDESVIKPEKVVLMGRVKQ